MSLAFVSSMNTVPWGGSEVLWYETALRLSQEGYKTYLSTPFWLTTPAPISRARQEVNIYHQFDYTCRPQKLLERVSSRLLGRDRLKGRHRWLRQVQPKILCISNGHAFQGLGWMEAAIDVGIPYVTIAQAHADFLCPDGPMASRLIGAFSKARANYFVSLSNQDQVESQLGWKFPNARQIPNHSISITRAGPLPWPSSQGPLRLACVARLHIASKGQDLLFKVLASKEWRDRRLEVSLYGVGEQESVLRRLAAVLGISSKVHFMGHNPNPLGIWNDHHALILPSRYEGMPLVVMEAMLAGRPVIANSVAGIPELVTHGYSGFLAEAATFGHLHRAMEDAWSARTQWTAIGTNAYAEASVRAATPPAEILAAELLELI